MFGYTDGLVFLKPIGIFVYGVSCFLLKKMSFFVYLSFDLSLQIYGNERTCSTLLKRGALKF